MRTCSCSCSARRRLVRISHVPRGANRPRSRCTKYADVERLQLELHASAAERGEGFDELWDLGFADAAQGDADGFLLRDDVDAHLAHAGGFLRTIVAEDGDEEAAFVARVTELHVARAGVERRHSPKEELLQLFALRLHLRGELGVGE